MSSKGSYLTESEIKRVLSTDVTNTGVVSQSALVFYLAQLCHTS